MNLVAGPLETVIVKLGELLKEEYNLHKGVRNKITSLSWHLERMHAAIRKVAKVPPEQLDEQVKLWASDVREMSYDIEDKLDPFLVPTNCSGPASSLDRFKRLKEKTANLFGIKKSKRGLQIADGNINQIVRAIKEIEDNVKEVSERGSRISVDQKIYGKPATNIVDPRLPAMYRNERELIGIDDARNELVKMLTQGDEIQRKVSILGPGGIGKTTLAKAVYNRMLGEQFDCRAFVPVSRNPDMKKFLNDILLELDEEKYSRSLISRPMDEHQLIREIQAFLHHKRFFIVIDDIWDRDTWHTIEMALIGTGCGSRIITTTRNSYIANNADDGAPYRLVPLSHANSEKLFYKRILGGQRNCPDDQLAAVSDMILKKCGGLPLAIITVASVLAGKPWEEWSEAYNSVALRHENNRYMDNMRMVLSLSYYDLPRHLRVCLLHLSVFPEDSWIEKDFLMWKWIAEGFVHQLRPPVGLFEIGEGYLDELVKRSVVQIEMADDRYKGPLYGCRVHPMMLSLIRNLSREQSFFMILFDNEQKTSPKSDIVRRLALYKRNVEHDVRTKHSMSKFRSFNAHLCVIDGLPQLSSFRVLRVLALEYCTGMDSNQLRIIGGLVQLRYLGLVGTSVLELPEETVQGLSFLQTLDLRETGIEELPRTIIRLKQLMCLCADRARAVPEGMGKLISLADLRLHYVNRSNSMDLATELALLQGLRVLVIGFEEMDERLEKALVESLHKLTKIQHVEVYCEASTRAVTWVGSNWMLPRRLRQLTVGGGIRFPKLPTWINNPSHFSQLSHLHMVMELAVDEDLAILGNLQALRSLMLMTTREEQEVSTINTVCGNGYPALTFFTTNMLVKFECTLGAPMPRLEDIEFHVNARAAKDSSCWFGSLSILFSSLHKVTVALKCCGASPKEVEEGEAALRREVGILQNRLPHPTIEVIMKNEVDEDQFHLKNPHMEALQREKAEMQANRMPASDDRDEIVPVEMACQ